MNQHQRNGQIRSSDKWTLTMMVDCLWRSSLKVPRATRPLSDCCSQIREPLVSSEDRDNDTHTCTTYTHPVLCCSSDLIEAWSSSHTHPSPENHVILSFKKKQKNTPCLNVYINGYFFCQCSFSVDYDVLSVEVFPVVALLQSALALTWFLLVFHK